VPNRGKQVERTVYVFRRESIVCLIQQNCCNDVALAADGDGRVESRLTYRFEKTMSRRTPQPVWDPVDAHPVAATVRKAESFAQQERRLEATGVPNLNTQSPSER
jgi:hypothetical protein